MENNTNQTQPTETITEIQKTATKPRFNLTVNKILIIIATLIFLGGMGVAFYQYEKAQVTTTGADIKPVIYPSNDPYVELGKFLDLGNFSGDGFNVASISATTKFAVFLDKPYDVNQAKFVAWLKANGYGEIPMEKIVYLHNP